MQLYALVVFTIFKTNKLANGDVYLKKCCILIFINIV